MRGAIVLSALLLALPVAAAAQDAYSDSYDPAGDSGMPRFAGLRGSLAFINYASTTVPAAPPSGLRAAFDNGGGGSVYVGARLPEGFRVELEGLYRYLPVRSVGVGNNNSDFVASGHVHLGAPMVNLLYELPVPEFPLRPFFGAGLGGAYVSGDVADGSGNDYLRMSNWHFAYQFMGGAEFALSQSSRLTAMYRWLQVDDVKSKCGISGAPTFTCATRLNTQSIDLGLEMDM
jgi:opacity protein-like surface antigen